MGIIRRRKTRRPRLTLKVHALQAHNVTIDKSGCNPICLAMSNGVFSRTAKQKNTSSPTWNQVLKLKLPQTPTSEYLRIVVYDALNNAVDGSAIENIHSRGGASHNYDSSNRYLYLGEVRLSLRDLFRRKDQPTSYKFLKNSSWYPLFNRNALKSMHYSIQNAPASLAVGGIQLAISITCPRGSSLFKVFNEWQSALANHDSPSSKNSHGGNTSKSSNSELPSSSTTVNHVNRFGREDDEDDEDEDDITDFEGIVPATSGTDEDLETPDDDLISLRYLHEQLDNDDDDDDENDDDENDDVDDLSSIEDGLDSRSELNLVKMATALDEYDVALYKWDYDSSTEPSRVGTPPVISEESNFYDEDGSSSDGKESKYMSLMKTPRRPHRRRRGFVDTNFEVSRHGHAMGVAFMDIDNINDLPVLKNKFSKRYLMDPFIVITFGRRVFKTSCKKHSLDPVFNERLAFEIFANETNFNFHFRVIDKDSFSYHDNVASADVSLSDVMQRQQQVGKDDEWAQMCIPLHFSDSIDSSASQPVLNIRFKFASYQDLKKHFWEKALNRTSRLESFDVVDVTLLMEKLGTFSIEEIHDFFYFFNKSPWSHDKLCRREVVDYLQSSKGFLGFKGLKRCPLCSRRCKSSRNAANSKLIPENDLITHLSICSAADDKKRMLKPSYVSSDFATKRWFSKFLIKLTYGKYALGSNNANILVQDRDSGIVLEEKISAHVRLGIRIIYNARGTESKKFKNLLKNLSVKQGKKFDSPASVRQIVPFIKFHSLDISQCEETEYKTFNEFFYRKLKPGSRSPEVDDPQILLSPADSRCTVFSSVKSSKEIWIKGRSFTLTKLAGSYRPEVYNDSSCSIGIFRLAPQDYHRFHCPCDGVIGKPQRISGEYYTVNPMAVRTELDVFGENVRVVVPIHSPEFGTILYIAVGAMMVGSIILTCKEGDSVQRGQELGYFKFGGSTILLVIPTQNVLFDTDLLQNSNERIETLVKVGMSIGHTRSVKEHKREKHVLTNKAEIDKIKRIISVSDEAADHIGNVTWEFRNLQRRLAAQRNVLDTTEISDSNETAKDLELMSILSG
ncbi:LANO_0E15214g1_1 [Lachancea nothofagi CBS 11611]|uniref:Phosphatidylserine decarboxylase proenzyme 2 n=1 Tax=Lachancea nothofagi CBS 11611 TaxID=1266666 RepID=A0A1G4K0R4_9SACH|nr:LANO_0E15214g1_1 [Lachancea nothofagi CBS 11611]